MSDQHADPVGEAIEVLGSVVKQFNEGEPDTKTVLRRCMHAALLMGRSDASDRFYWHLNGFPEGQDIPVSRKVRGNIHWSESATSFTYPKTVGLQADRKLGTPLTPWTSFDSSIDQLSHLSQVGCFILSTSVQPQAVNVNLTLTPGRPRIYTRTVYPWNVFPAKLFELIISAIREEAYTWALATLVALRYENRISTIWSRYRKAVDAKIATMNLDNSLSAIDVEVGSDNPAQWSSALYSCRNMLNSIANFLWQAPDKEAILPGQNNVSKTLKVTPDKYTNRLMVYLYAKAKNDDERKITLKEAEYLGEIMKRIYEMDNHAHGSVSKEVAESAALHTYIFLADLIRLTGMDPLTKLPGDAAKTIG